MRKILICLSLVGVLAGSVQAQITGGFSNNGGSAPFNGLGNNSNGNNSGTGDDPIREAYKKAQESYVMSMPPGQMRTFMAYQGQPSNWNNVLSFNSEGDSKSFRRQITKSTVRLLTPRQSIEGLSQNQQISADLGGIVDNEAAIKALTMMAANAQGANTVLNFYRGMNEIHQSNLMSAETARTIMYNADPSGYLVRDFEGCLADRKAQGSMSVMVCLGDVLDGNAAAQQVNLNDKQQQIKPEDYVKMWGAASSNQDNKEKIKLSEIIFPENLLKSNFAGSGTGSFNGNTQNPIEQIRKTMLKNFGDLVYEIKPDTANQQANNLLVTTTWEKPDKLYEDNYKELFKEKWKAFHDMVGDYCTKSTTINQGKEGAKLAHEDPLSAKNLSEYKEALAKISLPFFTVPAIFLDNALTQYSKEKGKETNVCTAFKQVGATPPEFISAQGGSGGSTAGGAGGGNNNSDNGSPSMLARASYIDAVTKVELYIIYKNAFMVVSRFNDEQKYRDDLLTLFQKATNIEDPYNLDALIDQGVREAKQRLVGLGEFIKTEGGAGGPIRGGIQ